MVLASGAAGSAVTTSNLDDACVTPVPVNSPVTTPAESMRMRSVPMADEVPSNPAMPVLNTRSVGISVALLKAPDDLAATEAP